jgi:hypothetical protein
VKSAIALWLVMAGLVLTIGAGCESEPAGTEKGLLIRPGREEILDQRRPQAHFPELPTKYHFDDVMAAIAQAREDAFRKITEQVDRLYIKPDVQVGQFAEKSTTFRRHVESFVRSSRTVGYEFTEDGRVKVEVEAPLVLLVDELHECIDCFYPGSQITHDEVESMLEHYPGLRFLTAVGEAPIGQPPPPQTQPTTEPE